MTFPACISCRPMLQQQQHSPHFLHPHHKYCICARPATARRPARVFDAVFFVLLSAFNVVAFLFNSFLTRRTVDLLRMQLPLVFVSDCQHICDTRYNFVLLLINVRTSFFTVVVSCVRVRLHVVSASVLFLRIGCATDPFHV